MLPTLKSCVQYVARGPDPDLPKMKHEQVMQFPQLFACKNAFYHPVILDAVTKNSVGEKREGEVGSNKEKGFEDKSDRINRVDRPLHTVPKPKFLHL